MAKNTYQNERVNVLRGIAIIMVMVGHGVNLLMEKGYIPKIPGGYIRCNIRSAYAIVLYDIWLSL